MNKLFPIVAISGLFALTACPDDNPIDSDTDGDTSGVDCADDVFPGTGPLSAGDYAGCNPYTGDTVISYFPQPSCSGNWEYNVELKGTAGAMKMYSYDFGGGGAGQYGEEHDLDDGDFQANGWWDAWGQELNVVATLGEQTDNESTIHACGSNNGSTLIWAYEAYSDEAATNRIDCVTIIESSTQEAWLSDFNTYHNLSGCDSMTFTWTDQ